MAALDNITGNSTNPASSAVAVTPNDTADLTNVTRAIYIGTGGNLSVIMQDGSTCTFTGVLAGTVYPLRVSRVRATGTTAGSIVALW